MEMLTYIVYFIRTVFIEGIVINLSIFLLTNTRLHWRRIVISGIILGLCIYIVRLLPIHYGVHTLILLILIIGLNVSISKINLFNSIIYGLFICVMMYIIELLYYLMYVKVIGLDESTIVGVNIISTLVSLPPILTSLLVFFLISKIKQMKV